MLIVAIASLIISVVSTGVQMYQQKKSADKQADMQSKAEQHGRVAQNNQARGLRDQKAASNNGMGATLIENARLARAKDSGWEQENIDNGTHFKRADGRSGSTPVAPQYAYGKTVEDKQTPKAA